MAEDTRRPVRRPQRLAQAPKPNASLYVGYVEDDESVDSIMRKFSELEKIERKAKRQQDKCTPSSSTALSGTVVAVADAAVPVTEQGLATSSAAPCVDASALPERAVPSELIAPNLPAKTLAGDAPVGPVPPAESMQPENSHVVAAHHAGGSLALDEAESNGLTEEQLLEVFRRTSFLAKRHKRPQTTSKRASRKWHDDRDSDEMEEDMLDQLGRLVHQTDTQPGQSFPANDLGESTSPSVSDETPGRESDSSNDDAETPRRRVKWGSGSSPSPQAVGQKRNLKMIKHGSVDQQARASGSATHLAPLHTATNLSTASAVPVVRTPKIEKHTATAGPKKIDRRTLLDKYKDYQDTSGNRMSLKRKSKSTDPTLPVYMRLTPGPLPPWVLEIGTFREQAPGARWLVADILRSNLAELTGQTFEGILIDAPLARSGEPATPGMVTVDELKAVGISPALIPRGFIFMWAEKEWIPDLLEVAQAWGFHYVENICWVRHNINNKVSREDSRFFRKSKLLLLIFRNDGSVELRHQRNPDVVLDFIQFDIGAKQVAIPEEKPQPIYSTIETLLPNANATALPDGSIGPGKLLELSWRAQPFLRRGWTTISHSQSLAITGPFHYSANQASHALYRNPNHMEAVHRGLFSQHVESAVPTTLTGPPSSSDPSKVEQP